MSGCSRRSASAVRNRAACSPSAARWSKVKLISCFHRPRAGFPVGIGAIPAVRPPDAHDPGRLGRQDRREGIHSVAAQVDDGKGRPPLLVAVDLSGVRLAAQFGPLRRQRADGLLDGRNEHPAAARDHHPEAHVLVHAQPLAGKLRVEGLLVLPDCWGPAPPRPPHRCRDARWSYASLRVSRERSGGARSSPRSFSTRRRSRRIRKATARCTASEPSP